MFDYYVVGKKDNDCYVLHDARENMGGKACASKYTISQLIDKGYSICGVNVKKGDKVKNDNIVCVGLDGKPIKRDNSYPSVDNTKRSASTFEKGIKRSREEIKKAKEVGEKRSETIQKKKEKDEVENEIVVFFKEYIEKGSLGKYTMNKIAAIYNYGLDKIKRVDNFEQVFDKDGHKLDLYFDKSCNACITKKRLDKKSQQIIEDFGLKNGKYIYYTFYHTSTNTTPNTNSKIIDYVLKTTKKPILYTYGLKYRHPTTCDVPINRNKALEIWNKRSLLDIDEKEDAIYLNEYSSNDMW